MAELIFVWLVHLMMPVSLVAADATAGGSASTPMWLDILLRAGLPTAALGAAVWKLWPMFTGFIEREQARSQRLEAQINESARKQEETLVTQLRASHEVAQQFAHVLEKYNKSNTETVDQLAILGAAFKELSAEVRAAKRERRAKNRTRGGAA